MADHVEAQIYVSIFTMAITECILDALKHAILIAVKSQIVRLFASSGHMVRNKLCWDANYAVELSIQRNCYQSSLTFLKHGLNMSFFTTCKGFQLSINKITVIPLSDLLLLHSLYDKIRMYNTLSEVVSEYRAQVFAHQELGWCR